LHVEKDGVEAKFWMRAPVALTYNDGFNAKTLRDLTDIIEQHRDEIERAWHEFFS